MSDRNAEAAYTELSPDAWHQHGDGTYSLDCPECGSAATLMNVVKHGRCNGYLDQREPATDIDEETVDCTATLWLELGYTSHPDPTTEDAPGESATDAGTDEGVPVEGSPAGTNGAVEREE